MLSYQSPSRANTVFEAIVGSFGPATTAMRVAVAYVSYQGAHTLIPALAEEVGDRWEQIPKTLVTCFDFGHTEPNALAYLQENGITVRIANLGAAGVIRIMPNPSSFHPKMYLATTDVGGLAVVGSANLSRRALTVNSEVVATMDLAENDPVVAMWDELVANSVELTDDLLQAYRAVRPAKRAATPTEEPVVPVVEDTGAVPVFRVAVETGAVDPAEYQVFWVEAGYTSGGSGNQLELPRRAQNFFGFAFDRYDDEHHTIGHPTLGVGADSWSRPLTWHGNNRMERVNLPTTAQSGLTYRDRVVLFQRASSGFDLTVADKASARANSWRDESAAEGTLFRVSDGNNRLCGLI